jgi:hypothetical protein
MRTTRFTAGCTMPRSNLPGLNLARSFYLFLGSFFVASGIGVADVLAPMRRSPEAVVDLVEK